MQLSSTAAIAAPRARTSERGFTLVELMVVVAIIALLAAIIIPNYVHSREQAAVSQTEANMKQIATALELYYTDKEAYPASGTVDPALFGGAGNPYLTSTPTNAKGRNLYTLTTTQPAGLPPTYVLKDPDAYDPTTLENLTKAAGGTCAATCTHVQYDPQNGFAGT